MWYCVALWVCELLTAWKEGASYFSKEPGVKKDSSVCLLKHEFSLLVLHFLAALTLLFAWHNTFLDARLGLADKLSVFGVQNKKVWLSAHVYETWSSITQFPQDVLLPLFRRNSNCHCQRLCEYCMSLQCSCWVWFLSRGKNVNSLNNLSQLSVLHWWWWWWCAV